MTSPESTPTVQIDDNKILTQPLLPPPSIFLFLPDILLAEVCSFLGTHSLLLDISFISHRFHNLLTNPSFQNLWTARFYAGRTPFLAQYLKFPLTNICFRALTQARAVAIKHLRFQSIEIEDLQFSDIHLLESLPITKISLDCNKIDFECIKGILSIPNLHSLILHNANDKVLALLHNRPEQTLKGGLKARLHTLSVSNWVTHKHLFGLPTMLHELDLFGCTEFNLKQFLSLNYSNLLSLKILTLIQMKTIHEDGFHCISQLTELEELTFHCNENKFNWLSSLVHLRILSIGGQGFYDHHLTHLEGLPLQELFFNQSSILGSGLKSLALCPQLHTIEFSGLDPIFLPYLVRLPLQVLEMDANQLVDTQFPIFPNLSRLSVGWSGITDQWINDSLSSEMKFLRSLSLASCPIKNISLKILANKFPFLEDLNVSDTKITGKGLKYLVPLKNLRVLQLSASISVKIKDFYVFKNKLNHRLIIRGTNLGNQMKSLGIDGLRVL